MAEAAVMDNDMAMGAPPLAKVGMILSPPSGGRLKMGKVRTEVMGRAVVVKSSAVVVTGSAVVVTGSAVVVMVVTSAVVMAATAVEAMP